MAFFSPPKVLPKSVQLVKFSQEEVFSAIDSKEGSFWETPLDQVQVHYNPPDVPSNLEEFSYQNTSVLSRKLPPGFLTKHSGMKNRKEVSSIGACKSSPPSESNSIFLITYY